MVNKVFLLGRLTADPDVRALPSGSFVANLRLATNTYAGKEEDGTRKEHTDFHSLVAFERLAELAGELLRKGRLLYVEGRLRHRTWESSEGQKRHTTEVVVIGFQLLEPKPAGVEGEVAELTSASGTELRSE
jgi:single-strand DNA-binding protein